MELTRHIQRQPEHQEESSSMESSSFVGADILSEQASLSGAVKPRGSAMSSSSLQVQKKATGTASASAAFGSAKKDAASGTISNAVTAGITSVMSKPVIVDNGAKPASGQMTQTAFLDKLDLNIRAVADPLLKKKKTSTDQCPWLYWAFMYYEYMASASEIQTALNTYIPSTRGASSATDLINKVCAYVKTHVTVWVNTGKVTGVPKDVMANLAQVKKGGMTMQKKSADGSVEQASGAEQIHHQLQGGGQSLNGSLRSKMESAMGADLSGVKIHTGGEAGSIASEQNAKALTVGQHIAFGSGQYQPGTMHGDALIAHELAHTIQQKGAEQSVQSKNENQNSYDALEHDADNTAVSAVSSIWGSTKEWMSGLGKKTGTALKSGLQLQKCGPDTQENTQADKEPVNVPVQPNPSDANITISTTDYSAPVFIPGGGFSWIVNWHTNGQNGWIIQKVKTPVNITDCSGTQLSPDPGYTATFWEAWKVENGVVKNGRVDGTDGWQQPDGGVFVVGQPQSGTKGTWETKASVYFVPGANLPGGGWTEDPSDPYDLFTTSTDPGITTTVKLNRYATGTYSACGVQSTWTHTGSTR